MPDIGRTRQIDSVDGVQSTMRKHRKSDEFRLGVQNEARRAKDKNIKEPLPTVKRRRLNLEAGRSELASRLQDINPLTRQYFE
jgi:hypothetical protein